MRLGVRKTTDKNSVVADLSDRSTDYRRIRNRKNRFYLNLLEKHLCPQTLVAEDSINTQGDIARLAKNTDPDEKSSPKPRSGASGRLDFFILDQFSCLLAGNVPFRLCRRFAPSTQRRILLFVKLTDRSTWRTPSGVVVC